MNAIELTVEEEIKRSNLAQKLKKGEITIAEALELRNLLQKEKQIIFRQNISAALFLLLLFLVVSVFLSLFFG